MPTFLPRLVDSNQPPPDVIVGYASVRSRGGTSILELSAPPTSTEPFRATERDRRTARRALEASGFTILGESRIGYGIAGSAGAFEAFTGGRVVAREELVYASATTQRYVTRLDIVGPRQPSAFGLAVAASAASRVEGVVIERPRVPMAVHPSPLPPAVSKYHLRVPDDVEVGLDASGVHHAGRMGTGVTITMIDSGHYLHPFFLAHHYAVSPVRTIVPNTSPTKDPVGHGTGESANIFACAPGVQLQPIRVSDNHGNLVAAIAGLQAAKSADPKPRIITNSWGGDLPYPPEAHPPAAEQPLILEIMDALEQGIVVVFSAGNGQFSVEPQIPGVFAAGGAYLAPDHSLVASNYASGYASPWYPGVTVPTASALVGLLPRAQYLMLPVPAGCPIDVAESQAASGDTADGTASNDGWALFSGTSAAAPQIAGVCALLLEAKPTLTPAQVRECLVRSATDVVDGRCHPRFNHPATPGNDLATGAGLVNAGAAVQYALSHFA
jgi:subtilisin family serine protease